MARPLPSCAAALRAALLEGDVDPTKLCEGGMEFYRLIDSLGSFAKPVAQQASGNLEKIRNGAAALGEGTSMRKLLQLERDSGMHRGTELKDPSAAMGALWIVRFLAFWEEVCLARINPDESIPFKETLEDAYKHNLQDFSGGMSHMSFHGALLAVPPWKEVRAKLGPPGQETFQEDVFAWIDVSQEVGNLLMKMIREYGMEDKRKSI
ncbi:hypothetical protein AB1Y20_014175 [Prymnesium parvum]|uniref:Glycolipid transfer protein domain-containing protein n=1 Tax=Prymnesium parvum TaxID=97485 RepID=A0AB34IG31_PRYPA